MYHSNTVNINKQSISYPTIDLHVSVIKSDLTSYIISTCADFMDHLLNINENERKTAIV